MPATGNYILNAIGPSGAGNCKYEDHGNINIEQACALQNCCITDATAFRYDYGDAFLVNYDNIILANASDSACEAQSDCDTQALTCYYPDYDNPVCDGYDHYDVYIPYGSKIRMSFYVQSKEETYTMCGLTFYLIAEGLNPNNRGVLTTGSCLNGWFYVPGSYSCRAFKNLDYGITPLASLTGPVFNVYDAGAPLLDTSPPYIQNVYFATWSNYAFDSITYCCEERGNCCPEISCGTGSVEGTLIPNFYPPQGFDCECFLCEYPSCFEFGDPTYTYPNPVAGQLKECSAYWDYECDVPCGVRVRVVNRMYWARNVGPSLCSVYIPGDKFSVEITCEKACPDV